MAQQAKQLREAFTGAGVIIETNLDQGLSTAAMIVERDAKSRLKKDGHISTGLLHASVTHRLIVAKYRAAQIGTNVSYAKDIEFGSAPHKVPIGDLKKWAKRKFGDESIAYAVQKVIEERGTKPYPFLIPALNGNRTAIFNAIKAAVKKGIKESGK